MYLQCWFPLLEVLGDGAFMYVLCRTQVVHGVLGLGVDQLSRTLLVHEALVTTYNVSDFYRQCIQMLISILVYQTLPDCFY